MRIQEIEEKTGITCHNIRYYEKEKLICPQRNSANKYREYTEEDVERLNTIKLLRMMNIPVKSIREYFDGSTSLEVILKNNLCILEEEESQIKKSKLLNQHLLESGIEAEIPAELLTEIFSDEALYFRTIEEIKRQDIWSVRKFLGKQIICIAGWLAAIIMIILYFFTMMEKYVNKTTLVFYALMLGFVFVLLGRAIYQNDKMHDNL